MSLMDPTPLILHTPMPIDLLTQVVADMGTIDVDVRPGGDTCCFYGWGERMEFTRGCKPHHLVFDMEPLTMKWLATTLKALGEEVVVTEMEDWSNVINLMPILYDDSHQH